MADNIRLVTFAGSTVTPQDDALVYETAVGQNGIIYGGAITLKNNNTLHIAAGHGIVCGRKFTIVEGDITVLLTNGATHLGRIYLHLDLSNTTDPIQILTEVGSSISEPVQNTDVNISNGVYEFNLATFTVDALTISDLVDLRPTIEKVMDVINKLREEVDNAEVDTLTTLEQVDASTDKAKPVGAGAVQELHQSLGEQPTFVYDENGQITGYKTKVGADTVFPFSNSVSGEFIFVATSSNPQEINLGFRPSSLALTMKHDTKDRQYIVAYANELCIHAVKGGTSIAMYVNQEYFQITDTGFKMTHVISNDLLNCKAYYVATK